MERTQKIGKFLENFFLKDQIYKSTPPKNLKKLHFLNEIQKTAPNIESRYY